jgi:hypothetical protein
VRDGALRRDIGHAVAAAEDHPPVLHDQDLGAGDSLVRHSSVHHGIEELRQLCGIYRGLGARLAYAGGSAAENEQQEQEAGCDG